MCPNGNGQQGALLRVAYEAEPHRLVVSLHGELDVTNCGALLGSTHLHSPGLRSVLLDLHDLTFCDSAGLRALLALREEHVAQGRSFSVTSLRPEVQRIFDISGLSDRFAE